LNDNGGGAFEEVNYPLKLIFFPGNKKGSPDIIHQVKEFQSNFLVFLK